MQKILIKRVFRNLYKNLPRYLTLLFLVALSLFIVISYATSGKTQIIESENFAKKDNVEDGEFITLYPLRNEEIKNIEDVGCEIEKEFNVDYPSLNDSVLRAFRVRKNINLLRLLEGGNLPSKENEVVLERRYSEVHNLYPEDTIEIGNKTFTITGITTTVDYEGPLKTLGDASVNSELFGTCFLSDDGYSSLLSSKSSIGAEEYLYSYKLKGATNKDVKEKVKSCKIMGSDISNLAQFIEKKNNLRIHASKSDAEINVSSALLLGVIVLILFSYIIAVFVTHEIEKDNQVIGTLYALGVTKKDLMFHYLFLSVFITFIGGVIGLIGGSSTFACNLIMKEATSYFSLPDMTLIKSPFVALYAIFMPPLIALIVNVIVISKKLNKTPLSLIRNEGKVRKVREVKLTAFKGETRKSFIARFRIRELLRESRSCMAVVFGIFLSYIILLMGLNCYVFCTSVRDRNKADIAFRNMYTYKYLQSSVPEKAEGCYAKTLIKNIYGFDFNVTVMGIKEENDFFDLSYSDSNGVTISDSVATKFNCTVGDTISLYDENEEKTYSFKIGNIIKYSPSFMVFMDIDKARSLFDIEEGMYNVALSNEDLDIDKTILYNTLKKEDIIKSGEIFISLMWGLIYTLLISSCILFIFVMYLMMKVMLDNSSNNIALFRVFGYQAKELRKLYLDGNFIVVALGSLIALPLAKLIMDALYPPFLISNVASGVFIKYPFIYYPIIYVATLILYIVINNLLMIKIKKMQSVDVLKNRE